MYICVSNFGQSLRMMMIVSKCPSLRVNFVILDICLRAVDPLLVVLLDLAAVSELDFIKRKNLSSNGCIKTPLYRLIELRLTFGYLPVQLFTGTYLVSAHFPGDLKPFYRRN